MTEASELRAEEARRSRGVSSPRARRRPRRAFSSLPLAPRIVLGVGMGLTAIFLLVGAVALATVNSAADAAGREQVVLAEELAAQIGADSAQDELTELLSPGIPADLRFQLVSASGVVLAQTTGTSPVATAEHVDLLRPLMISGQPGYRIHRPGPQDTFAPHLVAYAPLPRNPAVGVVVQQSQATILDAPELLVVRLAVVGLLALALALAVAWFDVHRVVEPLQMLTAAAKRFAEGQLDDPVAVERGDELGLLVWNARQHRGRQTIAVDRDDEIGLLARSFEQMRRRLRQSLTEIERWNQELERRVAERTEEIARRNRERAQLLAQIMAAQEDERRRLAGELHDEVSQTLASVLIALESLPATEALTPRAQERVRDLGAMIAATIDNVHGLAAELRPSLLDDVGLVAALDRLVGEFRDRHGLPVDFQAVGVDGLRLLPPVETALFRIAQAALNNVHYHAAARAASVLLQRRGDRLLLVVEDDGRGFDLEAVRAAPLKDRLGLAGIEERAQLVGARLTIESEPGHGTSLYVELPVAPNLRAEPPRA